MVSQPSQNVNSGSMRDAVSRRQDRGGWRKMLMSLSDLNVLLHRSTYPHTYMHEVLWKPVEWGWWTSECEAMKEVRMKPKEGAWLPGRGRGSQWGGHHRRSQAQTNLGRREPDSETHSSGWIAGRWAWGWGEELDPWMGSDSGRSKTTPIAIPGWSESFLSSSHFNLPSL